MADHVDGYDGVCGYCHKRFGREEGRCAAREQEQEVAASLAAEEAHERARLRAEGVAAERARIVAALWIRELDRAADDLEAGRL